MTRCESPSLILGLAATLLRFQEIIPMKYQIRCVSLKFKVRQLTLSPTLLKTSSSCCCCSKYFNKAFFLTLKYIQMALFTRRITKVSTVIHNLT